MRWKYVIPTVIMLAVIIVFNIFFFDSVLKLGLVKGGEWAFGAKVEIASLKTRLGNLSVVIQGVQVADKQNPMTNLVEIGALRFSVQPLPLLTKKVVINEMSVAGLQWGTARKISGALPPAKQKQLDKKQAESKKNSMTAKLMAKLEARGKAEVANLPALQTIQNTRNQLQNFSVDKMVNVADLQSVKQLENIKLEYQQKVTTYDTQLKTLDVQGKIQSAQPVFNDLNGMKVSSPQEVVAAKDKIDRARNKLQELQTAVNQVQKLKKDVEQDFGQSQQLINRINELKEKDMRALSDKFKLPTISFENLARSLVGPLWLGRINTVLGYIEMARKYMPPRKKTEQKVVKERLKGVDVSFPVAYMPPDFWIKKILLSGSTGGTGKKNTPLDFKGEILDVNSDPALLGKPTVAKIQGKQAGQTLQLTATLDHTQEVPVDRIEVGMQGIPASGLNLPSSEYLPAFNEGRMSLNSLIQLRGDTLQAKLEISLTNLGAPQPSASANGETQKMVQELWQGIPAVSVNAAMTVTGDEQQLSVTSNLDSILSQRLKALVGGKLAEVQQKLRAEVDKQLAAKQKEVMNQFNQSKQQLLSKLGVDEKMIQDKMNGGQGIIKQKEDAGQQAVEQQKKQAVEQLKNQAQEKLKGLFGR